MFKHQPENCVYGRETIKSCAINQTWLKKYETAETNIVTTGSLAGFRC